PGPAGSNRYWNTGSWIYEPDLSSREAYLSYLRNGWPGTAVLIDSDEPQPRLLRLREHLNPLHQMTQDDDHPRRHRIHRIGRGDDQPRARG
ncbi:MAG: hypothetical protein JO372_07780, partial [Solirubrobacterales bacterium]|nr:hypothetical protein [Solirubrobacterales bacterium]